MLHIEHISSLKLWRLFWEEIPVSAKCSVHIQIQWYINHCWNPRPSKNWVSWGGIRNVLLERRINLKRGGGIDVEMGGCHFFITLQFNHIYSVCVCVWGGVRLPLLLFGSSVIWVIHTRFSSKSSLY